MLSLFLNFFNLVTLFWEIVSVQNTLYDWQTIFRKRNKLTALNKDNNIEQTYNVYASQVFRLNHIRISLDNIR